MKTAVLLCALAAGVSGQADYFQLKDSLQAWEASMKESLAALNASIDTLSANMNTVSTDASVTVEAVTTTFEVKANQTVSMMAEAQSDSGAALSGEVSALTSQLQAYAQVGMGQASTAESWLTQQNVGFSRAAASQVTGVMSQLQSTQASFARSLQTIERSVQTATNAQISTVVRQTQQALAPAAQLTAALATTHYTTPSTPMFRWHMFHVYSNNGVGWFDGNNPRFFGGRHPSQWGDGNTNVWDMHHEWSYMARIFTRRGVGSTRGATVCSETWYLYSSTDTKYCLALFRVKNTGSSNVQMRWNWYGTGWSGWGNFQSATVNGNDNWHSSCTWWCHRGRTFTFPGNRVNTIIFANGMTHPNHYADNHHIEATFLGFDGLALPRGLEYVDDLDIVGNSGRWR